MVNCLKLVAKTWTKKLMRPLYLIGNTIEVEYFQQFGYLVICHHTKEAFAIVFPDRTAPTLTQEIADHISTGSIIHSDSWASYQQIEAIPNKNFVHYSVNHSKNSVDLETGSHSQSIKSMWRDLKVKKKPHVG